MVNDEDEDEGAMVAEPKNDGAGRWWMKFSAELKVFDVELGLCRRKGKNAEWRKIMVSIYRIFFMLERQVKFTLKFNLNSLDS